MTKTARSRTISGANCGRLPHLELYPVRRSRLLYIHSEAE